MIRTLEFNQGIIGGEEMHEMVEVFPEIESAFKQRKQYFEYYYSATNVEITLDKIQKLNDLGYGVKINYESLIIKLL